MKIDTYIRDKIFARIKSDIKAHMFSNKSYPQSVTVVTEYAECTQKIIIDLTDLIPKEGENNDSM